MCSKEPFNGTLHRSSSRVRAVTLRPDCPEATKANRTTSRPPEEMLWSTCGNPTWFGGGTHVLRSLVVAAPWRPCGYVRTVSRLFSAGCIWQDRARGRFQSLGRDADRG